MRASLTLRPYQIAGVDFLLAHQGCLLADEMGLGKTAQVISAIREANNRNPYFRVLIVCPSVLRTQWAREFQAWAPTILVEITPTSPVERQRAYLLPRPVTITSYEQLRADVSLARTVAFDLVVLDEAQRIKNPESKSYQAVMELNRKASWVVTGTPFENSISDLVAIGNFLRYAYLHEGQPLPELRERLNSIMLRRTKAQVAPEMPPIIDQTVLLSLEGEQARAYRLLEDEISGQIRSSPMQTTASLWSYLHALKQLCNYDDRSGTSAKAELLGNIVDNAAASDDKVIVASQYVQTLKWLRANLPVLTHAKVLMYTGEMTSDGKDEAIERFLGVAGHSVLLLSTRAGAYGLNLPTAEIVVLFDRWWNPSVESQTIARAHRLNRIGPLHVFKFLVRDSIEERIQDILTRKQLTQESLLRFDADQPRTLNREELLSLFQRPLTATHTEERA